MKTAVLTVLVVVLAVLLPIAASAQQPLTPMPMFSAPPQVNFGSAYNDCPSGSSCGQAAWIAGQLINAGGFVGGMAVIRPPVTSYNNSFNSAAGANASSSSSSSSLSSATGESADPNPSGGSPTDPNPPQ